MCQRQREGVRARVYAAALWAQSGLTGENSARADRLGELSTPAPLLHPSHLHTPIRSFRYMLHTSHHV